MALVDIHVSIPSGFDTAKIILSDEVTSEINSSRLSVQRSAMGFAPVKTGNLRRSITSSVAPIGGQPAGIVSATARYAKDVEFGTGIYGPKKQMIIIKPKNKRALFWPGATHPVKSVKSKGMRPRPFMRRAFDDQREKVILRVEKAVQRAIERMNG